MNKHKHSSLNSQSMDINSLLSAVDNEANEGLMELTHAKIKATKNDMLQRLQLSREKLHQFHQKLKHYRYIDEFPDLKQGTYVRWIPLNDPKNIRLTNGGIVCSVYLDAGVNVVCKNHMNRMFQFKLSDSMVFQKITEQEEVLLSALDFLEKK